MVKVYVDSNVFISIVKGDFGRNLEFMELRSDDFLNRSLECEYDLVISNWVLKEFYAKTGLSETGFQELIVKNPAKVKIINVFQEDLKNAKLLINQVNGFSDCVHVTIALKNECDFICTWNVKDFFKLEENHVIKVRKPDEL